MRTLKRLALVGVAATGLLVGTMAPHMASAQPPAAPVFDAAAKRQAIATAAKLLIDDYIFPDMGAKAAALLTQNLAAGKYDADSTPDAFATQLTKDLQGLTHDKHMRVEADGPPPPDANGQIPGPPPPIGLYAFIKVERLKGNIGYIKLDGFLPKRLSRHGADKAMALVASTDALIIDLRGNGGGDPAAVSYLVSFFTDPKTPVHVNDLIGRKPGTTDYDRQVYSTEPTPTSYLDKPVYLITSANTFSGGEEFSYDMQTEKRATLIGETTGGGANPGDVFPIGPGLSIFVPDGRGENPITHTNWEGTGVHPDIATPAAQSFQVTYATALRGLGRSPSMAAADTPQAVLDAQLLVAPRSIPTPGSEAILHQWEAGMASNQLDYRLFTEDGAKEAKEEVDFLHNDLTSRGALQSLTFAEVDVSGGDVYEAIFADKSSVQFTILLSPDGKIETVFGQPY